MEKQSFYETTQQWSTAKLMSYILNGGARYQSVEELEQALNDHFLDFNRILQMDEDALRERKVFEPNATKCSISNNYVNVFV